MALRDTLGELRGTILVREAFVRDLAEEARLLHGTDDVRHPAVRRRLRSLRGAVPIDPRFPVVVARPPTFRRGLGARETLLDVIILRNFGASHIVLGPTIDLRAAHALLRHAAELGVTFVDTVGAASDATDASAA